MLSRLKGADDRGRFLPDIEPLFADRGASHVGLDALHVWSNLSLPLGRPYLRRHLRPEFTELFDCTYSEEWSLLRTMAGRAFKRLTPDAAEREGLATRWSEVSTGRRLRRLRLLATHLGDMLKWSLPSSAEFAGYVAQRASEFLSVAHGALPLRETVFVEENYCHFGVLFIGTLWPELLPPAPSGFKIADLVLGKFHCMDFLSSTSWPLDYLDIHLQKARSGDGELEKSPALPPRTALEFLSQERPLWQPRPTVVWDVPVVSKAVDPQGSTCLWRGAEMCSAPRKTPTHSRPSILVAAEQMHVSLTPDVLAMLLRTDKNVHVTLICADMGLSKEERRNLHMGSCGKMCDIASSFCTWPRIDWAQMGQAAEVYRAADVIVCTVYRQCVDLGVKYEKPLIMYDGLQYGCPFLGQSDPSWGHLEDLRALVARDIYVREREEEPERLFEDEVPGEVEDHRLGAGFPGYGKRPAYSLRRDLKTLVFATDIWQAESIFYLTGKRVPSVRPSSFYLAATHMPGSQSTEVLIHNDRGRCLSCDVFRQVLQWAAPSDYPLKLLHRWDYLSFADMAAHRAMVLVPHGNVIQMMFFEVLNLALPVFLPDARFMLRQPFLWWAERMGGKHSALSPADQARMGTPPRAFRPRREHPYNPFVLAHEDGPERLSASLYWLRYLDFFHWPGVLHFESLPDLLHGLVHKDLAAASRTLRRCSAQQRQISARFWRDAMGRLLYRDGTGRASHMAPNRTLSSERFFS
eukprot:TRINITY_DN19802_c0_g1_i1.p1 TRINITY_DN19802_c0_g1~~TRINITY_DN19802_c0_g1_i1.p1  ORF type:complete len:748 (-),score=134.62 TRINITY_DN19802_c0_g1_i1:67-2310(-)